MKLRLASRDDISGLTSLIERSARALCSKDYTDAQIEAALGGAWAVDTNLIDDQTYFVCTIDNTIVGCGGWSKRATLFGGNAYEDRNPTLLDPKTDRAKIRAFFVNPDYVGHDVGQSILTRCEEEAKAAGFTAFELMATLTGARFYRRHGYLGDERNTFPLTEETTIDFIPMIKAG